MSAGEGLKPTRKVGAGGLAGAATVVLVWAASLAGLQVPVEVAAAVAVLLTFGTSYLVPEPGQHART